MFQEKPKFNNTYLNRSLTFALKRNEDISETGKSPWQR